MVTYYLYESKALLTGLFLKGKGKISRNLRIVRNSNGFIWRGIIRAHTVGESRKN